MERTNIIRQALISLGVAAWVFLLLSLGSFHPTDWPSHAVYPYGAVKNLCGPAGALVAYGIFFAFGQGAFPMLFFTCICLALVIYRTRLSDPWLRVIGLLMLCAAFAALVHHLRPGSYDGLPEGHGGIVGIGAASFLQSHFNTAGTRLLLLTAILVGLLLAADDLVLHAPGFVAFAAKTVHEQAPNALPKLKVPSVKFNFPKLPTLPSLPRFITKDAGKAKNPIRKS